ncbi:MAG: hypothetical protein PVF58_12315 [Candidatus Methanofastidiosia archaeon]|jgi:hypothetical protein
MFCPKCGSRLQDGYCPRCHVKYHLNLKGLNGTGGAHQKKCPKCRSGEMVWVGEKKVGLLIPPVGLKSKIYKCNSCGYETSEGNLGSMLSDENIEKIKKDLKINKMKRKIKDFVNEKL